MLTFLADTILLLHFGIVLFIVMGLALVWIGFFLKWKWIHHFYFRVAHIVAMGIVVLESCFGFICPCTTWENDLRVAAGQAPYEQSFVAHWVHRLMFYQFSEKTFTIIYIVFFALVVASFIWVRPSIKR
jgi:hypothetical protein